MTNAGTPSDGINGERRLAKLSSASKMAATVTGCGRVRTRLLLLLRTRLLLLHMVFIVVYDAILRSSAHPTRHLFTEVPERGVLRSSPYRLLETSPVGGSRK